MRKVIAFLVSPMIPSFIASLLLIVSGYDDEIQFALFAGLCVGYPVAMILGIPLDYFVFSKTHNRNIKTLFIWTGAVTICLVLFLFLLESGGPFGLQIAFSPAFWTYVSVFWISFFGAAWCFLKIAYERDNDTA